MGIGNKLLLNYAINTYADEINDDSNVVKQMEISVLWVFNLYIGPGKDTPD
jgi:hypothetical protein